MDALGAKIAPIAQKIGANLYLTVLRDAFMLSFPLTMFGSFIVVFNNLPFWPDSIKTQFSNLFGNGQNATMSIMTVFVTLGIGYHFWCSCFIGLISNFNTIFHDSCRW